MAEKLNQDSGKGKQVSGGWALILFGTLFLGIVLLGWLTL